MIIKIICPICKASNALTSESLACRRCREDLSLLYKVKGYSYKYRLKAIQYASERQTEQAIIWGTLASHLDKLPPQ